MKKIIIWIFLLGLCFQEYHRVDLNQYRSDKIVVEVKGEVKQKGTISVDRDAILKDVIDKVGVSEKADLSAINQARSLENGMVIVIPARKENKLISINTASLAELDELVGIGPSIAQRILDFRNLHPFSELEQLMEVKGIGPKMYEKIKEYICL